LLGRGGVSLGSPESPRELAAGPERSGHRRRSSVTVLAARGDAGTVIESGGGAPS